MIHAVGIAGAGTMGRSMAQIFAQYGYTVTIYNHREETLKKAEQLIGESVCNLVDNKKLTEEEGESLKDHLSYTTDLKKLSSVDLIVENIAENLEIKKNFYEALSEVVSDETIVVTNTSGLSINKLAGFLKKPERFLGMHWFNPPHIVPLIEIIKHDTTDPAIAQMIYDLSLQIDKKPAMVDKDVPGFAANRLQLALAREALALVHDGVITAENVDAVIKYGLGFRWACLGPLETMDFGGLDIFYHIAEYLTQDLCDSHDIPALLKECYENGNLGVKTGSGFYEYPGDIAAKKTAERDRKLLAILNALYGK